MASVPVPCKVQAWLVLRTVHHPLRPRRFSGKKIVHIARFETAFEIRAIVVIAFIYLVIMHRSGYETVIVKHDPSCSGDPSVKGPLIPAFWTSNNFLRHNLFLSSIEKKEISTRARFNSRPNH
jgi:hypothetical protein